MKKLNLNTLYILLATVLLIGCTGVETPNIDCKDRPFIVGEIKYDSDGIYKYIAKDYTLDFMELLADKQSLYSKEKFNIGDTLRLKK